jgi:ribose 5-phosphate isomerase B
MIGSMRIIAGADNAGFTLKDAVVRLLRERGHEVVDVGTGGPESVDYPEYAARVGSAVAQGKADRGILFCSTGVGMSIAANKIRGVRAALASNADAVCLTRAHNDANVLAIGARYTDETTAAEYVNLFLDTPFDGGRHARRLEKVAAIEAEEAAGAGCRSGS